MPRHPKSTKVLRGRSMIAGLKKHAPELPNMAWGPGLRSVHEIAARFQAHLHALDAVAASEVAWREALGKEAGLEKEIKSLLRRVALFLRGVYGEASATLRDFGLAPRKKAKISAEKMSLTVAKRNATRKARRTMGKRQKRAIKGAP
jgi:hypothetical protein